MGFGEKFKNLVDGSGKSYDVIAAELGLKSRSSVSHYMKSEALPKYDMLVKMCTLFEVPMNYFAESGNPVMHQVEISYETEKNRIPIMSDEGPDAVQVGFMALPHTGITNGFAIVVADKRLENIGIGEGDTVILSRDFKLADKHRIIVRDSKNGYFAKYEKIRENYARIIPANPEISPIMFEEGKTREIEIYAVVKYIMREE